MKRTPNQLRAVLFRLVLYTVLWWGLSEGRLPNILPALGVIALTTGVSFYCIPPGRWNIRVTELPGFLLFFLVQTFLAGMDVARRAFHPRLPLAPKVITYTLQLPRQSAKIFFVWTVSLLPGTASISLKGNQVLIHVLDKHQAQQEKLQSIEERIAYLFGSFPS
ncbi:Na+/H+ antiporter subunit E [Desulfocastanea catecholica]